MPATWLNVPLFPQNDRADCLPTCVEMVLAFFGRSVRRNWLSKILESTEFGTPGYKVVNLQPYGYDVTYTSAVNSRPLKQALEEGLPPIVMIFTAALTYWQQETAHSAVVIALDNNEVVLNDPAFPDAPQVVSYEAFMLAWSDLDYLYAVIRKK